MNAPLPPEPAHPRLRPGEPIASRRQMSFGLVVRLAVADLWHERMLTACVIIALTAVLAPLLILFSLKYGLVETMRTRLVSDPRNREIRPELGHSFTMTEIDTIRALPGVQFVVPNTRTLSSAVRISLPDASDEPLDADLLPTGPGDPLLLENNAQPPPDGCCVLSHRACKQLLKNGGIPEDIQVTVTRSGAEGNLELDVVVLKVTGVTDQRATDIMTVFAPLDFLERVESWRDGRAVKKFDWPGGDATPEGVTDRVLVSSPRAWEGPELSAIPVGTPWVSEITPISQAEVVSKLPIPAGASHFYELTTSSKRHEPGIDAKALMALRRTLPLDAGAIYVYCRPLPLQLVNNSNQRFQQDFHVEPFLFSEPGARPSQDTDIPDSTPPSAPSPAPPAVLKAIPVDEKEPAINIPASPYQPQFQDLSAFKRKLAPPPQPPPATPSAPGRSPGKTKPKSNSEQPSVPKSDRARPPSASALPRDGLPRHVSHSTRHELAEGTSSHLALALPRVGRLVQAKASVTANLDTKTEEVRQAKPVATIESAPNQIPPQSPQGTTPPSSTPNAVKEVLAARSPKYHPLPPPDRTLWLPKSAAISDGDQVTATFESAFGPIAFPAIVRHHPGVNALMPQSLASVLRLALDRGVGFDTSTNNFFLSRRGYPTIRIVTRTIDDVEPITSALADRQVSVTTAAARIRDVQELDRYTTYVFSFIAAVGLVGAASALLASLFAAVERKRRSLGVLRLLGLRRSTLMRLPLYQSAVIVSLSVGIAVLVWHRISSLIIDFSAGRDFLDGDPIQTLPTSYLWAAWGGALIVAIFASLLAGIRVMRVDPSEAIRDE